MVNPDINTDTLEISFSCASSYPCRRWDETTKSEYIERLLITEDAVNLDRLRGGASVLKNHDTDKILGVVRRAWIEDGAVCVRIQFRTDDMSRNLFDDIVRGIVPNVSIGYSIEAEEPHTDESGALIRIVTRWTALEISIAVGVPADPTVGFYRNLEINNINARKTNNQSKEAKMTKRRAINKGSSPPFNILANQ